MSEQSHKLSRETLNALNNAALLVAREVDLELVLQQIVDVARELIDARYAALGVADAEGHMVTFIHSGMAEEVVALMPHLPHGKGLLGAIIDEQKVIRLANIADDGRSVGFPQAHPPMSSMLGVPLIADGEPVGNLYLTNKLGSAEFTDEDQIVAEMLGAHAAWAIVRARLYHSAEQRNQQLTALNTASMAVVQELSLDKVLQHIVDAARQLVGAQYAALGLPNSDGLLDEFIHSGMSRPIVEQIGHLPEGRGLLGTIIIEKRAVRLPQIGDDPRSVGFPQGHPPMDSFLGVPIVAGDEALGNLYFTNKLGAVEFSVDDQEVVEMLAIHAAVAIQNAHLYEQVQQLAVVHERDRIGMDLHDGVIQSIYAVGLMLDSLKITLPEDDESQEIVEQAVNGLNIAIQDIRNFIMDLRPRRFQGDLIQGLRQLLREFQANTMISVDDQIEANVATLNPALMRSIFLSTQEALANIARHAKAQSVKFDLVEDGAMLCLIISDDGRGFDLQSKSRRIGHGLANMRSRAKNVGGSFEIDSAPSQGTTLTIKMPLGGEVLTN